MYVPHESAEIYQSLVENKQAETYGVCALIHEVSVLLSDKM